MPYFLDMERHAERTFESQPEVVRICRAISGYLAARDPDKRLHLTLSLLRAQTRPRADADLLVAIQYLTGSEAGLLETNFEYAADEGEFVPLSRAQVSKGQDGISADLGVTFTSTEDFESRVLIYFSPSKRAREAMRSEETA